MKLRDNFKVDHKGKKMYDSFENILEAMPQCILIQRLRQGQVASLYANQAARPNMAIDEDLRIGDKSIHVETKHGRDND